MSKATEDELATMHGAIARGLTTIITEGVNTVLKAAEPDADPEVVNSPASAAYYMAAITFAKNNNITADPTTNAELSALANALKERRAVAKTRMTTRTIENVAEQFERDLGDFQK
jgi:hypothetical protein